MSWEEMHRIQQLESKVRKLEDRLAELEACQVLVVGGRTLDERDGFDWAALAELRKASS